LDEVLRREKRRQDLLRKKETISVKQTKKVVEGRNGEIERGFEQIQTRLDFLNKELHKVKAGKHRHRAQSVETMGSMLSGERVGSGEHFQHREENEKREAMLVSHIM